MAPKRCHEKREELSIGGSMKNRLFSIKDTVNCPCKHRLFVPKTQLARVRTPSDPMPLAREA